MSDFYADTLQRLIRRRVLTPDMRVLVVCGGQWDRDALLASGFQNAVVSNLDDRFDPPDFAPYQWSYQDAEDIHYADDEFDVCIAHSGLHHCQSPHRALLEMYRVAKVGVVVFEPIDNFTTRVGVKLGLGEEYEVGNVAGEKCKFGGLRNTPIPNHVYRWTEREVEKTIRSYSPIGRHEFHYFYKTRINWARARAMKSPLLRIANHVIAPLVMLLGMILPRESNNFAFCVIKPTHDELHPWLQSVNGQVELNCDWMKRRFHCDPHDEEAVTSA